MYSRWKRFCSFRKAKISSTQVFLNNVLKERVWIWTSLTSVKSTQCKNRRFWATVAMTAPLNLNVINFYFAREVVRLAATFGPPAEERQTSRSTIFTVCSMMLWYSLIDRSWKKRPLVLSKQYGKSPLFMFDAQLPRTMLRAVKKYCFMPYDHKTLFSAKSLKKEVIFLSTLNDIIALHDVWY